MLRPTCAAMDASPVIPGSPSDGRSIARVKRRGLDAEFTKVDVTLSTVVDLVVHQVASQPQVRRHVIGASGREEDLDNKREARGPLSSYAAGLEPFPLTWAPDS